MTVNSERPLLFCKQDEPDISCGKENFMTNVVWGICLSFFYNNKSDREQRMVSVRDPFSLRWLRDTKVTLLESLRNLIWVYGISVRKIWLHVCTMIFEISGLEAPGKGSNVDWGSRLIRRSQQHLEVWTVRRWEGKLTKSVVKREPRMILMKDEEINHVNTNWIRTRLIIPTKFS